MSVGLNQVKKQREREREREIMQVEREEQHTKL